MEYMCTEFGVNSSTPFSIRGGDTQTHTARPTPAPTQTHKVTEPADYSTHACEAT